MHHALEHSVRIEQHKLEPVLLIDSAGAGVVIDGHDVDVGILFVEPLHHPLAADMVRQTSEGLGADDVFAADAAKLHHFRCKQPAFSHLHAGADIAFGHSGNFREGRPSSEIAVFRDDLRDFVR